MLKQFLFALAAGVTGVVTAFAGFAYGWPFAVEGFGFLAVASYVAEKATNPEFELWA